MTDETAIAAAGGTPAADRPREGPPANAGVRLQSLSEQDWRTLISRIRDEKCTPIIGPGAYDEVLSRMNMALAEEWVRTTPGYPFGGYYEIARVAQFLSVVAPDPQVPKDEIARRVKALPPPVFAREDEPHRILAGLPLPIYLTTNYDNFMFEALRSRREKDKAPVREFCHWSEYLQQNYDAVNFETNKPTVANPVVYHLHGYERVPESLVLADDDYLDFLVNIAEDNSVIPERIQRALTGSSLLLLGFRLDDWNFRALFRSIVLFLQKGVTKTHVSVQLVPELGGLVSREQEERAKDYFTRYFGLRNVKVYWGTCQEFVVELKERWEAADAQQ